MSYRQNNRDANEAALIEFMLAVGCHVIQMDRHKGFDLLVFCPRTGTHIIEIKNPARTWKLTSAEQIRKLSVEHVGGVYNIITNQDELRLILGIYD
jgi:hypothetical protein